eukprot:scaffold77488_cov60-Phaeocystis_antarctica.AAC.5
MNVTVELTCSAAGVTSRPGGGDGGLGGGGLGEGGGGDCDGGGGDGDGGLGGGGLGDGGDGGGSEGGGCEGGHAATVGSDHVVNSQLRPLVAAGHGPVARPGKFVSLSTNVPFSGLPPSLPFLKGYAATVVTVPPLSSAPSHPFAFIPLFVCHFLLQSAPSCRY